MNRNSLPKEAAKEYPELKQINGALYSLNRETMTYHLVQEEIVDYLNSQSYEAKLIKVPTEIKSSTWTPTGPPLYRQKIESMIMEQNPIQMNRLLAEGEWNNFLNSEGERLEKLYEEMLALLKAENPRPEGYLEAVSWETQMAMTAQGIVDDELRYLLED